ncbi:DnaJ [Neolecta irregularis DAH-3]|uniref:DnaJ n=1 Tax=Neolecta irregularis (strain DAH-3) TaxID=1198029 RepID=A0A1U7LRQ7_NEOID|nr:DnaJ [Neolecta irregularis DAH-3]|eukprot:OLL25232.1 DnaJ [Neolecta irregularis DAH-3]
MPVFAPTSFLFLYWFLPDLIYKIYSRIFRGGRRVYIAICSLFTAFYIAYALFNIISSYGPTYYDLLSVHPSVSEKDLKRQFRRLSLTHHPDKTGDSDVFIELKTAYDVLSSPSSRFAYDAFGPDIVHWNFITTEEYVFRGLYTSAGYYIVSTFVSLVLGMIGRASWGKFWRYLAIVTLAFVELHMITRPLQLPFFLPFQWIVLLREAFSLLAIAMTQLGPLLVPDKPDVTQELLNSIDTNVSEMLKFEASGVPAEKLRELINEELLRNWAIKNMQH